MTSTDIILGIYEVHNASAAIIIDGEVIAAAHEERFTGIKNDVGFPVNAARFCMNFANVQPYQITSVALSNESFNKNGVANIILKRPALYSISDWVKENNIYWKNTLIGNSKKETYFFDMGGWDRVNSDFYNEKNIKFDYDNEVFMNSFNELRIDIVKNVLGISTENIVFVPHFICHHYHAYYSSYYRSNNVLVAHIEGDGGLYNSAVSLPSTNGLILQNGTNKADIGRLYQWMTLLMGMKPYHHEYKLMGLAPYATELEVQKSLKVFEDIFFVDPNEILIKYKNKPHDLYFYFKNLLEGHRFDGIAGALQRTLEQLLVKWFNMLTEKYNKSTICYGGGVAMNVKANGVALTESNIKNLFVPLSPSDESNAIGAAYYSFEKKLVINGEDPNKKLLPLPNAYLGKNIKTDQIKKALLDYKINSEDFVITNGPASTKKFIEKIISGSVVARCVGREEFGQRSLGNRSILAMPNIRDIVEKINFKIKYRDFWMPFCPVILEEYASDFLENSDPENSRFMTTAYKTILETRDQIIGGIHPADYTARPQILNSKINKKFYEIMVEIFKRTGIPCLINTSLNLHGEPVVGNADDAVRTFLESGLDAILINEFLIEKR